MCAIYVRLYGHRDCRTCQHRSGTEDNELAIDVLLVYNGFGGLDNHTPRQTPLHHVHTMYICNAHAHAHAHACKMHGAVSCEGYGPLCTPLSSSPREAKVTVCTLRSCVRSCTVTYIQIEIVLTEMQLYRQRSEGHQDPSKSYFAESYCNVQFVLPTGALRAPAASLFSPRERVCRQLRRPVGCAQMIYFHWQRSSP